MNDRTYYYIDETILDVLFSKDNEKRRKICFFLDYLIYRNRCNFAETTPRIWNIMTNKVKDKQETFERLKGFIKKDTSIGEEEMGMDGINPEQELVNSINIGFYIHGKPALITEKMKERYRDAGNEYKLDLRVSIYNIDRLYEFLKTKKDFIEYMEQV